MGINPDDLRRLNTLTYAEVAHELGFSTAAVQRAYLRFGIERHPHPRHRQAPKSAQITEDWLRLHNALTAPECAAIWNVCKETIHRLRKKYGIEPKSRILLTYKQLSEVEHLTARQAAGELHVTNWQVRYWRSKYGFSGRGRGRH